MLLQSQKKTVTTQKKNSTPNKYAPKTIMHDKSMHYPCKSAQNRSQTPNKPGQLRGQATKTKMKFRLPTRTVNFLKQKI